MCCQEVSFLGPPPALLPLSSLCTWDGAPERPKLNLTQAALTLPMHLHGREGESASCRLSGAERGPRFAQKLGVDGRQPHLSRKQRSDAIGEGDSQTVEKNHREHGLSVTGHTTQQKPRQTVPSRRFSVIPQQWLGLAAKELGNVGATDWLCVLMAVEVTQWAQLSKLQRRSVKRCKLYPNEVGENGKGKQKKRTKK